MTPKPAIHKELGSILDVRMRCPKCGWQGYVWQTEPDCDGGGALGCPVVECGTVVVEA